VNISILHYAAPPIVGGVESTIYHHARFLTEEGFQVTILAGRGETFNQDITFKRIPTIDSRHQEIIRIGKQLAAGIVSEDFYRLRDELVNILELNLIGCDFLIVHNAITLHKNLALTAALKIISEQETPSLLAWCHDFAWQDKLYTPDLHPGYPWDLLKTAWNGIEYIAVSDHRRKRLAALLEKPELSIQVIPPGVDITEFLKISSLGQQFIEGNNILDREPVILLPARITRRKNIEFAIQVAAELKPHFPGLALVITGPPGPHNPKNIDYLEKLLELRKTLNLDENIFFIYEFGSDDEIFSAPDDFIYDLYQISDLVIFPSLREGFGIPVLEAGLAKIPIFASDIPPVRESSAGMISLFDPAGDPGLVSDMIIAEINSNRTYQFRRHVLSTYTWRSIVKNKIIPLLDGAASTSHE
jgi:glycosyltransferase involved in cell wall biosynthesis